MLRFILANTGVGKSSYVAARFGINRMHGDFARQSVRNATTIVNILNNGGFKVSPPPKEHLVYAYNMKIRVRRPEFGSRESWDFDARKLGFKSDDFSPDYIYPYSTLIVDEMHELFDSRNWQEFPEETSRYLEQCRKVGIEPVFIAQSDNLGELRIRQLCEITLIKKLSFVYSKDGDIVKCVWTVEIWDRYDDYKNGKPGRSERYVFNGNIFNYFDTTSGKERFFYGLEKSDFSVKTEKKVELTPESISEYAKKHPIIKKKEKKK